MYLYKKKQFEKINRWHIYIYIYIYIYREREREREITAKSVLGLGDII